MVHRVDDTTIEVEVPKRLSSRQKELLEEYRSLEEANPGPRRKSFLDYLAANGDEIS